MTYVNELPSFNPLNPTGLGLVQGLVSVDKTIHWANPLNSDCMDTPSSGDCGLPFTGSPPATVHLHGGEVSPGSDGGPDSWFTPDGKTGPGYRTLFNAGLGKAVYLYPNLQEPGTLFFHDHALGATRTNLYSGLAAFYFIRGPLTEPRNLPKGAYEIEMAIQDRQFDTNGQLIFPDGSGGPASNLNGTPPNPTIHPFWIPEFFGDVAIVNGAPWPVLNLEPRRTSSALWMARTRGSTI
jgi:FtsP/CotA-like multicopper oxidase with cupredoxin domain